MDDRTLMLILRMVHVLAGVFWVGSALLLIWFIGPVQRDMGREGGQFMQKLVVGQRLGAWLASAAGLTILSGIGMYWRYSAMTSGAFGASRQGMALGAGGGAAIVAAVLWFGVGKRAMQRIGALGAQLAGAAGPPDPAIGAEVTRLQRRANLAGGAAATLLVIATLAMAVARYL